MKNVQKFTKSVSVILALMLMIGTMMSGVVFAAPTPTPVAVAGTAPVLTSIKVFSAGTANEVTAVAANTPFDLVISIADTRTGVDAATHIPEARLATTAFSIGSVADITVTNINTNSYDVTFKNLKYLGGGSPKFDFTISYPSLTTTPVELATVSTLLSMCKEPPVVTPAPEATPAPTPTPTPAPNAPAFAPKSITASTNQVYANDTFTVTGNVLNTSATQTIENVTATVTTDTALMLESGSNTFYIGNIAPNAAAKASFKLAAGNTVEAGSYKATITYTGTWNGTPITCSQDVAVKVTQKERFEISKVEYSDAMFVNEENSMTVYYVNKGKAIIYNLSAEIKGNFSNPGQQQFVGNVAPGTETSLDFSILTDKTGPINGTIILTYENGKGEVQKIEKEFACSVEENEFNNGGMMDGGMIGGDMDAGMQPDMPKAGMPWWGWLLIAVAVVGVVVAVVIIIKKRKAKKLALEDEDEDI